MAIKIIVHYPETPEKQAQFDARVAKFHAEYVAQYIEKLNCPTEQKLKLLDAVAQTIMEQTEEILKKTIYTKIWNISGNSQVLSLNYITNLFVSFL